ncbi:MAG: glycerophosphodiester phosphodiesterase, partial [Chloroflexota bacterium]|nr:glycerophosphodiester phosphodiesterase [Chloroflexota bacterium]
MEIDVRLSADGVPILMHDETVDRTTNRSGPVRALTFAELQRADAGGGEPVPSLAQVLHLVRGRLVVWCELKATEGLPEEDDRLVDAVLSVVGQNGADAWVAIHSFADRIVERARRSAPHVPAALISPPVTLATASELLRRAVSAGAQAVSLHHASLSPELVAWFRARQLAVFTWTLDHEDEWQRALRAGVDGIITNYPHALRAHLSALR